MLNAKGKNTIKQRKRALLNCFYSKVALQSHIHTQKVKNKP